MAGMRVTPEELETLGGKFTQEAGTVRQLQSGISSALQGTNWEGNARNKFQQLWDTEYRKGLESLATTLEQTSQDLKKQAQQYRIADQQGG